MTTQSSAPRPVPGWAYASLAAGMVFVGSYVGLSKWLVAVFPVFLLGWLRFGIAAVAMVPWLRREPGEPALGAREHRLLFWDSLLGNFLFSVCMLYGVAWTSAVTAGVVMAGIPAAVALLSRLVLAEPLGRRTLAGIACAVAGIAALAWVRAGDAAAAGSGAGFVLLVGAVFCEASYVVIGKQLTGRVSARRISALVNLWGWALMTPLGVWQALRFDFTAVTAPQWGLTLYYALAASMASVWLWMKGLARVPAAQAGVYTVFLPLAAMAVGVMALGEPFTAGHAVAAALALAGVLLATWPAAHGPDERKRAA